MNALKIIKKEPSDLKVVMSGAGAAGVAIAKLLLSFGVKNIVMFNKEGIIDRNKEYTDPSLVEISKITNPNNENGTLADSIKGADVFVGVSAPNLLSTEMVSTMNKDAIIFAMANPVPEIFPEDAKKGGARIIGTGRSDFPNQVNNVLAFPGIFRGALDVRASDINEEMKLAAAHAIANEVSEEELSEDYILPKALNKNVAKAVAEAVKQAAIDSGVARIK